MLIQDKCFIEYCAPTLAGLKTASLFSCDYIDKEQALTSIEDANKVFHKKGIRAIPVRFFQNKVLIYVYRLSYLERDLCDKNISEMLASLGYEVEDMDSCVNRLCHKLSSISSSSDFPHEIGLFLGYPYEDVKGFMQYKGECSKCTGCWKVYGNKEKAMETFDKYSKCTKEYMNRYIHGAGLDKLAVVA